MSYNTDIDQVIYDLECLEAYISGIQSIYTEEYIREDDFIELKENFEKVLGFYKAFLDKK